MNSIDFRNNNILDIESIFLENGFNKIKICNFIKAFKQQNINNFRELKGIKDIKNLDKKISFQPLQLVKSISDINHNAKFIFKTNDNYLIESVLMPNKTNISICVSVQIGCKFNCIFCNTSKMGFIRNLYPHEILEQIRQINIIKIIPKRLSCISFMGMGEPFDNLESCMLALEWINSNWEYQISREKNTFSTSGNISFGKFLSYNKLPNLAVSLHSAIENKRNLLMPLCKLSLPKLKEYLILYTNKTKNHVSIEYCLLNDVNDSDEDINKLIIYVKGLPCKINLLNYNKTKKCNFMPVNEEKIEYIKQKIQKHNIPVLYRKSLGVNIGAGCGQLGS